MKLVFVDLETTGLRPTSKQGIRTILEVGIVVADAGTLLAERWTSRLVQPPPDGFDPEFWDPIAYNMHVKSGLLEECRTYGLSPGVAEQHLIDFMRSLELTEAPFMCGNSLKLDRDFLEAYMPELYRLFSYRSLDVSAIRCAVQAFGLPDYVAPPDAKAHRAIDDCLASIEQLRFYRDSVFAH